MLIKHQHPHNRSIKVAVVGSPNVGKSTLINKLIGIDLNIVTHKAQTTRNQIHCTLVKGRTEIILVDTPGIHGSNQEFNKRMNQQAKEGMQGADLNLLLVDLSRELMPQLKNIDTRFVEQLRPTWLVFTKADMYPDPDALPLREVFNTAVEVLPALQKYFFISSKTDRQVNQLVDAICEVAPAGPHYYDRGDLSNKSERFFVAEYIREQAFLKLKEELPYEVAVVVEDFNDLRDVPGAKGAAQISATILVNRPSQRAIVVGQKGQMIKEIGMAAREKIENLLEGKVNLNLHVKVSPRWFKNNFVLEELGLPRAPHSNRVWRQR